MSDNFKGIKNLRQFEFRASLAKVRETKSPVSRKEALEEKSPYFFSGKPCKNGHIDARSTVKSGCISCAYETSKIARAKWGAKNTNYRKTRDRSRINKLQNEGYHRNKDNKKPPSPEFLEKRRVRSKDYYQKNTAHV